MLKDFLEGGGLFGTLCEAFSLNAESAGYWLLMFASALLCVASGYLLGSVNAAIIISTKKYKSDIRTHGSGNAGMTNMFRTFGKTGGFLTLFGDLAKTLLPVLLGYLFFSYPGSYIAGLFVVLGHCFPLYYKFKGGKGVLAMFVMMLACDPPVFLMMILVFAIVVIGTRFVSMASVMTAFFLPIFINSWYAIMYGDGAVSGIRMPVAFLITLTVVVMHIPNLKRILNREEPKIKLPWEKKKK
ncbi:MAG: glycerol-3-phosphate 1-O-acyltransferase PlsY [Clostridia bacterium]|nr:glycerol-3-phosphate 1-O-acyltransferase PlsY [Clostridia bacterium]